MIIGNQKIEIEQYLPIDRLGEGCGYIKPLDGQIFYGVPYGFAAVDSRPFIEIYQNDRLLGTINCEDVSEIIFKR